MGKGKWKGDLRSELENAFIRETEVCVGDLDRLLHVHVCKVIVEHDNKRELEVGGSDGGAARLDNGLLAADRLCARSEVGICACDPAGDGPKRPELIGHIPRRPVDANNDYQSAFVYRTGEPECSVSLEHRH